MNIKKVIQSQYLAALAMLKEAIEHCPESLWYDPNPKFKIWSKAYHVVFFVHFYLSDTEKDFVEWEKHHDPDGDVSFTKDEVLEYLTFAEKQVIERILLQTWKQNQVSAGIQSINWNCNLSTSGTSSNILASCMNVWESMKK